MAPPPSTTVSPVVALIVRLLTFVSLLISVIIIGTNTATTSVGLDIQVRFKFSDFYAYRYMFAAGVIGIVYTLLQTAFAIFYMSTGNRLGGDGFTIVDFYGDKVLSYILATGAAAGFGLTVDLNRGDNSSDFGEKFLNMANASASLLFIGFVFSAVSSVFSSFSLPKKPV